MEKEIIHIVLSLYDKTGEYSRHAGVVLASIFENTRSKVQIHLLHDDTLVEDSKKKFELLVKKYEQSIRFHYVQLPILINQYKAINRLSRGSLFRCYICEALSKLDKVIYLDSDIIVHLDIEQLWKENVAGKCLCAVIDAERYRESMKSYSFYRRIKLNSDQYFNAGILLMNLQRIRETCCLSKKCIEFLAENSDAPSLDQDALNYLFQNDCYFINEKYNLIERQYIMDHKIGKVDLQKSCIWHFAGSIKPWDICTSLIGSLYWKYLFKTPWGERIEDVSFYISMMNSENFPLERVINSQLIGSRKMFVKNFIKRLFHEIKLKIF